MAKRLKVLVATNDFAASGLNILKENFTVIQTRKSNFGDQAVNDHYTELLDLIPGISALVWVSLSPVTGELLDRAGPQLKIVAAASTGYNQCNILELKARGIKLSNTPDVVSAAVAEIAVALMLGAARRFMENLDQVRTGAWKVGFDKGLGVEVRGSTVGVVGLGGIGRALLKRLQGFEVARFLYSGRREKPEGKDLGAEYVTQDELLAQSDFIVLAVPLNSDTFHLVNRSTLGMMKKNAVLVNVGRGELIDQHALYEALNNHDIFAAGLDVTTPEPLPRGHKLLTLKNLIILPHIGTATRRARDDMATTAARNVVSALTGAPLVSPILE